MTDKDKKKALNKHRSPVCCPGCGEKIASDGDLSEVEYVRTKRRTDVFFHTACFREVW